MKNYIKIINIGLIIFLLTIILLSFLIISLNVNNTMSIVPNVQIKNLNDNDGYTDIVVTGYTDEVLINPGKGLVSKSDIYDNKVYEVNAVCYYRFNWSAIESEEGVYNWNVIDNKMNNAINHNKKFAFGIMGSNVSSEVEYVTPKWVFDKGAQYTETVTESGNVVQKVPVWNDPIYVAEVEKLVKAIAERYDGNRNIAYIDNRSYGSWGEQHPTHGHEPFIQPEELKELYIQTYLDNFKKTRIVNAYGMYIYEDLYNWTIDQGMSIRADFIIDDPNFFSDDPSVIRYADTNFKHAYGRVPTIFETLQEVYNKTVNLEETIDFDALDRIVDEWTPSYVSVYSEFYRRFPEYTKRLANRIGFYFKYTGGQYKNNITSSENTTITIDFLNEGVAPLYEPCTVYIGLLDENDNVIKKFKTDVDAHQWMPNETKQEDISISYADVENGDYQLALGLYYDEEDENPTYLIQNYGKTNDNWYVFGNVTVNNTGIGLLGDLDYDGDITAYDAYLALKYSVEDYVEPEIIAIADLDNDNIITSYDAYLILKISIGLID